MSEHHDLIDPAKAVAAALTKQDRKRLDEQLTGSWQGAVFSEYLETSLDSDAFGDSIKVWWAVDGDATLGWLLKATGLPHNYVHELLALALIAHMTAGDSWDPRYLAYAAAAYAKGHRAALASVPSEPSYVRA